ncbi:hypothetical protein CU097_007015 [Rhizopus azygosporus]|uniref:Uncharacterized protein n=1 Tax=Rhizopus azygosporus TaxID=86630 RepID=A0A367J5S5_RHIAZ|nr:hypothetical protein CU097_007015 [Rhizopus azygosporus]
MLKIDLQSLNDEIASQLLDLAGESKQIQWHSFLEEMSQCIINNYKAGSKDKYQQSWRKAFKDNSKRLGIKVVRDTYRGDIWEEMIAGELKASITDTRNSSVDNSTSSLKYQKILTEKDKTLMKHVYDKISEK